MSDFISYPSIENFYNTKKVYKYRTKHPELETCKFVAFEKVDGANIQLLFTPGQELKVGRRTDWLSKDSKFFDIWNTLEKYKEAIVNIQKWVDEMNLSIKLYGELYGKGINNRVNYGPEQYICFFDLAIGGKDQAPSDLVVFLRYFGVENLIAPIVAKVNGIDEAIKLSPTFESKLTPVSHLEQVDPKPNIAEGLVIRPYTLNVKYDEDKSNSNFMLKIKDDLFAENEGSPKPNNNNYSTEELDLKVKFDGYCTKNRMLSLFSKEGPIEDIKQMGKYVPMFVADAKQDFLKDHVIPEGTDLKWVTSSGAAKCAILLKQHIMEGV